MRFHWCRWSCLKHPVDQREFGHRVPGLETLVLVGYSSGDSAVLEW
jgi:hypothetical protein